MWGWIIAALVGLAITHKASATGTPASGTVVTSGPVPNFGVVNQRSDALGVVSREPLHTSFIEWQQGPEIPVPAGSRGDLHARAQAVSDNKQTQIVGLQQYGYGPDVRNPTDKDKDKNKNVAVGGGGGGGGTTIVAGSGGGVSGGGGAGGGGGGFGGGGRAAKL